MVSSVEAPRIPTSKQLKPGDVLISHERILERVAELASDIARDYKGQELLIVGIMGGAALFHSDLGKALHKVGFHTFKTDWVRVGTYGSGTTSNKEPKLSQEMRRDPREKHVLVIDEVSETGHTIKFVEDELKRRGVTSVASVVFVQKDGTRLTGNPASYIGFFVTGDNLWLQGYGMDSEDGIGREDPDIRIGPYNYTEEPLALHLQ